MKTVYVEQITFLKDKVTEYKNNADLSDVNKHRELSKYFSDIFKDMHSVEEADLVDWVKGTSDAFIYYGGLYAQNPNEYLEVLDEIIDRLRQELDGLAPISSSTLI